MSGLKAFSSLTKTSSSDKHGLMSERHILDDTCLCVFTFSQSCRWWLGGHRHRLPCSPGVGEVPGDRGVFFFQDPPPGHHLAGAPLPATPPLAPEAACSQPESVPSARMCVQGPRPCHSWPSLLPGTDLRLDVMRMVLKGTLLGTRRSILPMSLEHC